MHVRNWPTAACDAFRVNANIHSTSRMQNGIPSIGMHVKNLLRNSAYLLSFSLIRSYQLFISPLLPPSCRYSPTCSQYAIDAIKHHGVWQGTYLAIRRVLRCHPFSKGGFDPVKR